MITTMANDLKSLEVAIRSQKVSFERWDMCSAGDKNENRCQFGKSFVVRATFNLGDASRLIVAGREYERQEFQTSLVIFDTTIDGKAVKLVDKIESTPGKGTQTSFPSDGDNIIISNEVGCLINSNRSRPNTRFNLECPVGKTWIERGSDHSYHGLEFALDAFGEVKFAGPPSKHLHDQGAAVFINKLRIAYSEAIRQAATALNQPSNHQ